MRIQDDMWSREIHQDTVEGHNLYTVLDGSSATLFTITSDKDLDQIYSTISAMPPWVPTS